MAWVLRCGRRTAKRRGRDPVATLTNHQLFERQIMFQKSSGQQPPKTMHAAIAAFEQSKLEQIAYGVANSGGLMPRNLTTEQRRAVVALVKNVTTKII